MYRIAVLITIGLFSALLLFFDVINSRIERTLFEYIYQTNQDAASYIEALREGEVSLAEIELPTDTEEGD